jgi:hypothetical protein
MFVPVQLHSTDSLQKVMFDCTCVTRLLEMTKEDQQMPRPRRNVLARMYQTPWENRTKKG